MNKTVVSPILLLREGGVVEGRGGRKNNVYSYFSVNERVIHSPTPPPTGTPPSRRRRFKILLIII
mgnify:CR=1 FL=1